MPCVEPALGSHHSLLGMHTLTARCWQAYMLGNWQSNKGSHLKHGLVRARCVPQCAVNPATALGLFKTLDVPKGEWMLQTAAGSALGALLCRRLLRMHHRASSNLLLSVLCLHHDSDTRPSSQILLCAHVPLQLSWLVRRQGA